MKPLEEFIHEAKLSSQIEANIIAKTVEEALRGLAEEDRISFANNIANRFAAWSAKFKDATKCDHDAHWHTIRAVLLTGNTLEVRVDCSKCGRIGRIASVEYSDSTINWG